MKKRYKVLIDNYEQIGNKIVLINKESGKGYVLNSSASDIFMFLAKHQEDEISLNQIQDYLRLIYPNVEHIEIEDILKCIHFLEEKGIVYVLQD